MKHGWKFLTLVAALTLIAMPSIAEETKEVTLEGGFVWERSDENIDGPLKAIFTATGEGSWDVAFHFDWEDGPHVYTGNCKGSMDGELSGNVTGDGERKSQFTFAGAFEDGTFSGVHHFISREGEERRAGTLTLSK